MSVWDLYEKQKTMLKTEIIIPHLSTPLLDSSLALCQRMILENTPDHFDVTVTVDPEPGPCPYVKWNRAAYASKADVLIFINNDMLMLPGWEFLATIFEILGNNTVATGYLIESGALDVNERNLKMDFGTNPDTFRRKDCEAFARQEAAKVDAITCKSLGWLMPVAFRRDFFCGIGGYDTGAQTFLNRGRFPDPLDLVFFDKLGRVGANFVRVNSWAYHFQRLSLRGE